MLTEDDTDRWECRRGESASRGGEGPSGEKEEKTVGRMPAEIYGRGSAFPDSSLQQLTT